MKRIMARLKGDLSVDTLFSQLTEALSKLPDEQRGLKRAELVQSLLQSVGTLVSIAEAWELWFGNPKKRNPGPRTLYAYQSRWDAFCQWIKKKHCEVLALHEVSPAVAEEYASQLWTKGVSPATYNAHLNFLRGLFKVLRVRGGLSKNVWDDLPHMELETKSRRALTADELARICKTAKGNLRYMFAIGLYTGMRLGDVCTLKWESVDLKANMIEHIPMKTKRKNRIVRLPIHPVLGAMLRELRQVSCGPGEYLFPACAATYQKDRASISKEIQKHFEVNKIKTTEDADKGHRKKAIVRVGFHSLRHSFVSLCAANNIPQVAIMELVGHGSPAMTRLYS